MTGGQTSLSLAAHGQEGNGDGNYVMPIKRLPADRQRTRVISATAEDLDAHAARMAAIEKSCGRVPLWLSTPGAE